MAILLLLAAVGIGAAITVQAGINAELARWVGGPLRAASISFVVGTLALVVVTAIFARSAHAKPGGAPWWAWLGGLCGAIFVAAGTALSPRLGALNLFVAVVLGQIVCSTLLDRFGILYPAHGLSAGRIGGIVLVTAGVVLVRFA